MPACLPALTYACMHRANAELAAEISSLSQELESAEARLAKVRQERREQDIKYFGKSLDDEADAKKAEREQAKKDAKKGRSGEGHDGDGAGAGSDEEGRQDDAEGAAAGGAEGGEDDF